MAWFGRDKTKMVDTGDALPGRDTPLRVPAEHYVSCHPIKPPFPESTAALVVGMGCFWGAERLFRQADGVYSTAVGYAGGITPNPTYEEVCSGLTGHAEVVLVVFEPSRLPLEAVLKLFWEGHDPTQGMRQGNDVGTQYRSAIYYGDTEQKVAAEATRDAYQQALTSAGLGTISTEIAELDTFYYAEDYHQQYLARNIYGYCGIGGTGVACPIGTGVEQESSDA